jgi:protoheme IX farnesyltransferase
LARSGSGEADGAQNGLYGVKAGSRDARNLFAFSILYLTLLFAALLSERAFGLAPLSPLVKGFS